MLEFILANGAFILLLALAAALLYLFFQHKYSYWSSRGIPGPRPIPLFGNIVQRVLRTVDSFEHEWLHKYGKIYGLYYGMDPVLTVIDPELIRKVMISDFPTFVNRRPVRTFHPIWNQCMFLLEDDNWKRVRTITTPSFTTGRLKSMHGLMLSCVDKLDAYFHNITHQRKSHTIEAREIFEGFTIDVVASTSFGIETNANNEKNRKNEFVVQGTEIFRLPPLNYMGLLAFPRWINDLLGIKSFFRDESLDWFLALARKIVNQRKTTSNTRQDLVQLMIDARLNEKDLKSDNYDHLTAEEVDTPEDVTETRNGKTDLTKRKPGLTEDEIVASCILYFIAGFEAAASTLSYCIYELSRQPAMQQRLYDEITEKLATLERGTEPYFDAILHRMPLLEASLKETLRKYPPIVRLERRVGVDHFKLGGIDLYRGQVVEVPVYAVHHCEDFYPDPETWNPERFLPENRDNLVPYTYLAFGIGPRNCVGNRFAYQELKLCLAEILRKYSFKANAQTPDKLKFRYGTLLLSVDSIPLDVSART